MTSHQNVLEYPFPALQQPVFLFVLLVGLGIPEYSLPPLMSDEYKGSDIGAHQAITTDGMEGFHELSQLSNNRLSPRLTRIWANHWSFKLPVLHVLAVFKPTTWGFFLGANAGLA